MLLPLAGDTANRYVYIASLYHLSCIAIYDRSLDCDRFLSALNTALEVDFPFRRELLLFRHLFYADLAKYEPLVKEFCIDPAYPYHPSASALLLTLSIIPIENGSLSLLSELRYDTFELLCQQMERDGHFLEAQKLHYLLLVVYHLQGNTDRAVYHMRRGLELAMEKELYWYAAIYAHYYPMITYIAQRDLPSNFTKKLHSVSLMLYEQYRNYVYQQPVPTFFSILSGKEYELAFLSSQGYTNRELSQMLHISEATVSKRNSSIYDKLGIKSKNELIELIHRTHIYM